MFPKREPIMHFPYSRVTSALTTEAEMNAIFHEIKIKLDANNLHISPHEIAIAN